MEAERNKEGEVFHKFLMGQWMGGCLSAGWLMAPEGCSRQADMARLPCLPEGTDMDAKMLWEEQGRDEVREASQLTQGLHTFACAFQFCGHCCCCF